MSERFVCGIDGGGTRTRVLLLSESGRTLGQGESGPGNLHDVGASVLRSHVHEAWLLAWSAAGQAPRAADAAFFGMASVVTDADRATVRAIGLELGLASKVQVDHDLAASLAGGLAGQPGITVIAGTGSSCFGRGQGGETWMAGGWGSFLDDRGSAFDLGRGALVACTRAHDGRGPETVLSSLVRTELALETWRELLARIDAEGMSRSEVAALAPLVTTAADGGDQAALAIIASGAAELAHAVATVAAQLSLSEPLVVATGGLAEHAASWQSAFRAAVLQRVPGARISEPRLSPVQGAALLALQHIGVQLNADAL